MTDRDTSTGSHEEGTAAEEIQHGFAMLTQGSFEVRRVDKLALGQGDVVDVRHLVVAEQHDEPAAHPRFELDQIEDNLQGAISGTGLFTVNQVAGKDEGLSQSLTMQFQEDVAVAFVER